MKTKNSSAKLLASFLAFGSILTFLAFCSAADPEPVSPVEPVTQKLSDAQPIPNLPFTISQSGSYCLTQNLTHTNQNTNAIEVNADNVTIDLAGFSLIGPGSNSGASSGIHMNGRANVEIRNGTITGFGDSGIWEEDSEAATGHRVISVRVLSNGGTGIELASQNNLVKDCTVSNNCLAVTTAWGGISCSHASSIIGNVVSNHGVFSGIITDSGCTISGNTVSGNGWGIRVWYGCNVTGNTCSWDFDGISAPGNGNLIKGNTVLGSIQNGIVADGAYNSIEENLVTLCETGINFTNSANFYANNRAFNNTTNYGGTLPTGIRNGGGNIGF
ncbi:MAG: hypothetical protein A2167_00675 [Planctomycetes bacterium RBG_13_46_10]|nr:MAG: hypothetical protein A2167_00675 [Planctomycetes bacterium RBG_13_46_10]